MLIFRSLASGSSGNAYLLKTDQVTLLFDAGLRISSLAYGLASEEVRFRDIQGIFLSHEHNDHSAAAFTLALEHCIPVYAHPQVLRRVGLADLTSAVALGPGSCEYLGDVRVECFGVNHDSLGSLGFLINTQERCIALVTDLGAVNEHAALAIARADLVVLESNHDVTMLRSGPYPYHLKERVAGSTGHLSNTQAGQALADHLKENGCEVWLAHLSRTNNTPKRATRTVEAHLKAAGKSPRVAVARRDRPSLRWTGAASPRQLALFTD